MSEIHTHRLDGCAPIPLANYLKALGVLRLVSSPKNNVKGEAADPAARGWWANERFYLRTRLDRDELLRFFLEDYAPSPIIAPWNGRSGFLEGDAGSDSSRTGAQLMKAVERSTAARFDNMRQVVASLRTEPLLIAYDKLRAEAKAASQQEKIATGEAKKVAAERRKMLVRQAEATKSALLPSLRSNAHARHLGFIDACFVLAEDERAAPLLGSGGNDGSRDFGVNFAEALNALFDFDSGAPKAAAPSEIEAAIFGLARQLETRNSIGQFGPGQGGPNGSTGYEGWNPLNRWDVLLLLEGALLFAGTLTRRWGVANTGAASFPFTFEPSRAGSGALSADDPNAPRGEIWTPLWGKPTSLCELKALLAEGRLTVGRATARTGLDAARAVARLGLSRGIAAFERFSLIQPDAKMPYQATPLGRYVTPRQPRIDPIVDLDRGGWLNRLRGALGKNAPARARIATRRLDDALFEIAREGTQAQNMQGALVALGSVASWLATSREGREKIMPPPRLGKEWVRYADDNSAEFRIAAALASIGWSESARSDGEELEQENAPDSSEEGEAGENAISPSEDAAFSAPRMNETSTEGGLPPPMAAHFAPVVEKTIARRIRQWADRDPPTVVWGSGNLVRNMIAVLDRRLIEQARRGLDDKPLAGSTTADLAAIAAFLEGPPAFDDARCAALLAGLVWAQPAWLAPRKSPSGGTIPFAYAALKPLFTPDAHLRVGPKSQPESRQYLSEGTALPIPPGLLARLRRGEIGEAVREAMRRAHASGIRSPFQTTRSFAASVDPARLAAALLIPIDEFALTYLMQRAYPFDERQEETDDAA